MGFIDPQQQQMFLAQQSLMMMANGVDQIQIQQHNILNSMPFDLPQVQPPPPPEEQQELANFQLKDNLDFPGLGDEPTEDTEPKKKEESRPVATALPPSAVYKGEKKTKVDTSHYTFP